jgi:hypothetical protein
MSDILPNMLIDLPVLGGDEGAWDDKINADFRLIDAHDHTANKGARITPAAMNINADLAFGGFFISALGKVSFTAIAAPSSGARSLFVNSADNELYWRTNAGTNVKLTSGVTINTSLVGGIAGDYAAVGAEVAYDDANDRYTFKQQGTKPWARIASGPLRLFEFNTTESVYVELVAPSGLVSSYTITLPLAAPGSGTFLQMSSAGVISASNTVTGDVTANDYKHTGTHTLIIQASEAHSAAATFTESIANGAKWTMPAGAARVWFPVRVEAGMRITGWTVFLEKNSNNTKTLKARMIKHSLNGIISIGAVTTLGTEKSNAASAPGPVNLTDTFTDDVTTSSYMLYVDTTGDTLDAVFGLHVTYTRP